MNPEESRSPEINQNSASAWDVTRREFVTTVAVLSAGAVVGVPVSAIAGQTDTTATLPLGLKINGQQHNVTIDPRVTLLDLLRENLALTGTKKGCDHGQCGACTVLVNGRRINSCLSLAIVHDGEEVTTVEGLAHGDQLHPVQAAFLEHDGFQCGYCTPGQVCSAVALLEEHKRGDASLVTADLSRKSPADLSSAEVRERMSGNICRCGAYPGIVAAVQAAAKVKRG
jgi:xanthine dehydrogenase YagT iron-sulfur-binding subunit